MVLEIFVKNRYLQKSFNYCHFKT